MSSKRRNELAAMRLLFRVEANESIGLGHLSRLKSIALGFAAEYNCKLIFALSRKNIGQEFLGELDCKIINNEEISDELIYDITFVDIPDLSLDEQQRLGKVSKLLVGIDDESPGILGYDVVIRPNLLDLPPPASCKKEFYYWRGKDYIILPPEFGRQSVQARKVPAEPRRWLICFGGSDPGNITRRLASILKEFRGKIRAQIILGCAFREVDQIRAIIAGESHISLTINCQNMAQAFAHADLAIISGGTLLYEGAALGVPMVVLAQNQPQQMEAEIFATRGAAINLGLHYEVGDQDLISTLDGLLSGPERLAAMSAAGLKLVSRHGASRIVAGLAEIAKGEKFCRKSLGLCSQPTFHG